MKYVACMMFLLISRVVISNEQDGLSHKYILTPDGLTVQVPKSVSSLVWMASEDGSSPISSADIGSCPKKIAIKDPKSGSVLAWSIACAGTSSNQSRVLASS